MFSLILPVYNCSSETNQSLPILADRLSRQGILFEIIVVDDHSREPFKLHNSDLTAVCRLVRNEKNYGKGYSVRKGFSLARGSLILFMDGDFPFDLEGVDRMIEAFKNPKTDIVIGDRSLPLSAYPAITTPIRKIGSNILSFFATRFITPGYSDTQCGIKGFRKEIADQIFPFCVVDGFSFDVEILFIAIKKKFNIVKIPVKAIKQPSSNVNPLYHGLEMLMNIGRIYIKNWRGDYQR